MSKNPLSEEMLQLIAQKIKKRFPETFRDIEKRAKEKKVRAKLLR